MKKITDSLSPSDDNLQGVGNSNKKQTEQFDANYLFDLNINLMSYNEASELMQKKGICSYSDYFSKMK